ncbi:MAG: M28 family peptidase [Ignavibacteriaceae bacterium]|jgi:Predicted aminopeptidases|nr:MAG: M28 family peptidase [Chlorobiota bacterium]KXK05840.1 MAG: aminopeptidase [Chlorobi bacterium OLB4]MBV6398331.1 hypothetical protein [Ignavibacteria bacterium]MCC6886078.1 M28 family peptidase [Ignavibacteriales bacterium]MCE7952670.1 PDZ domain-containing protein [Chlorobi bacterium CHB7]MDL1886782.1 M28 family peptidase [Ignavibacteria bacterium CHB1]MEB2329550.1 M28 family peptidase [Ignavibacteriaceae bacterium]OQY77811.1 MAG: hypothetical protein B6D43_04695 [Ignavibacteriales 
MKKLINFQILSLIVVFTFGFRGNDDDPKNNISAELMKGYVQFLADDSMEGRLPGTNGDKLTQEFISGYFEDFGLIPMGDNGTYVQEFKMSYRQSKGDDSPKIEVTTGNVLGMLEGTDPELKDEVIVIGAHHDHVGHGEYGALDRSKIGEIHNGADDNASGTSGVIELARVFSGANEKTKRSILFMTFGGEEAGLLGSSYFVKSDKFRELNIVAMLNMDMIGMLRDEKLTINGTGTSPIWEDLLNEINKNYNLTLSFSKPGIGPSDHSSFYLSDVPVLHIFTGLHSYYHRPSDTPEKLNYDGMVQVTSFVYDIAKHIANANEKPEFTKTEDKEQKMGNIKVTVGIIPDYAENESGLQISGVKKGSPAELGGLKGGDIITKFAGKTVKDIYDFTNILIDLNPEDKVECEVIRNGEKEVLTIIVKGR